LKTFLVIQTSFIGDVILATSLLESIHHRFPEAKIDIVVRNGNESLFSEHPYLNTVFVWNKTGSRYKNLLKTIMSVRRNRYNAVINAHRFASSGLITWFAKSKQKIGYDKNPLSAGFTRVVKHRFGGIHECERNHDLISEIVGTSDYGKPKLYPTKKDFDLVSQYQSRAYRCIAPTSVWGTKQWPAHKWVELINWQPSSESIYLLGAKADSAVCEEIMSQCPEMNVINLAGQLSLLQSAALMQDAEMNYVNDSAPMHLASSMNALTTAIYCSTIPEFGFGPLSDVKKIVQVSDKLDCRPCGLHGYTTCPAGHFKCAENIEIKDFDDKG
jgi:ADP-heptose:LPS heptosyltransferase